MKRALFLLPLLALSPLGYFGASYLDGTGALPRGSGFLVSALCMFILPWGVSALFVALAKTRTPLRVVLFISTLVAQPALLFTFTPPAATSEMMGIAHRLGLEFSARQLHDCADQLRSSFQAGTLATSSRGKDDHFMVGQDAVVVPDTELPTSLRGRFQKVFIQKAPTTRGWQVIFALGPDRGILCDSRKEVHEFFTYSIADGVHAYRYQRL